MLAGRSGRRPSWARSIGAVDRPGRDHPRRPLRQRAGAILIGLIASSIVWLSWTSCPSWRCSEGRRRHGSVPHPWGGRADRRPAGRRVRDPRWPSTTTRRLVFSTSAGCGGTTPSRSWAGRGRADHHRLGRRDDLRHPAHSRAFISGGCRTTCWRPVTRRTRRRGVPVGGRPGAAGTGPPARQPPRSGARAAPTEQTGPKPSDTLGGLSARVPGNDAITPSLSKPSG